jgi:hypothetical protein
MARPDDIERRFHEEWLGMVQPSGLVVSIPVLLDAQCFQRNPPALQQQLRMLAPEGVLADPRRLFTDFLDLPLDRFDRGEALPRDLAHYHERQAVTPTAALRRVRDESEAAPDDLVPDVETPATRAGKPYELLVLEADDFDQPDGGAWSYPPALKLERLIRDTRVDVGVLLNKRALRFVYAPHGQAPGSIDFSFAAMVDPGGRPILDALVMLLKRRRVDDTEWPLKKLLEESRERQASVTNALARQVFEALRLLLDGLQDAAADDGLRALEAALARGEAHVYGGVLTVLLRMVFVLYAEDRSLLPIDEKLYEENLSLLGLFKELDEDRAAFPDTMGQRLGAWPRVLALFRTLYQGARHGTMHIPARRGELFDPDRHPFLEGRAAVEDAPRPARVSDDVLHRVLERLLVLDRERISYRSLDVEQIGSVYEKLMGYHVWRADAEAACLKGEGSWVTGVEVLAQPPAQRESFLVDERGLPKNDAKKIAAAIKAAKKPDEVLATLEGVKKPGTTRNPPGRLVLQPGPERRRTSSHYTPRSLSEPVVRRALEPLLAAMGGAPTAEQLLELRICDPAMGSGAFLVEACRFLADQVVAAWARDPACPQPADPQERLMKARRLVAQRCLYGVDKNAMAVTLGRLSLWLVTMAADEPFTFVDHALKHGDSLVGLTLDQIRAFHWAPGAQTELFAQTIDRAVAEALGQRQEILDKAICDTETCALEKETLNRSAEAALARARLIADVCVGAWFAAEGEKAREAERRRRLDLVSRWAAMGGAPPDELLAMQRAMREGERGLPAFHWMLEFPEVFNKLRPDPLAAGAIDHAAWMDAFIGNPPFMGKNGISDGGGPNYLPWLQMIHPGAHGNADYVVHFLRRADVLLGEHGTFGFVATKTIAQGDSRATGLQAMVHAGARIYDAISMMKWPGEKDAAVSIATVHIAKGALTTVPGVGCRFEGREVAAVNSRLRVGVERPDPVPLATNANLSFQGSIVLGLGFTLTPEVREALVKKSRRNAERTLPYLGGEEVNTSPTQSFERYVINFGDLSLEEAGAWPDLLSIVRDKVKPERDRQNDKGGREFWWRFLRPRTELYPAIARLERCLVTAIVSKHLMFSFQPPDRVFSHKLFVFAFDDYTRFAALQSRIHERWTRLLSSSLEDRLNYSATDCFENFPFPRAERLPSLEPIGKELYDFRARLMVERNHGLTVLYNQLKDPQVHDPEIVALRKLHEDLDRAVLTAYGWSHIAVPPFVEAVSADEKRAFAAFEDAVIDKLFEENAVRSAEEAAARPPETGRGRRS